MTASLGTCMGLRKKGSSSIVVSFMAMESSPVGVFEGETLSS
jgi:hypothetical protein